MPVPGDKLYPGGYGAVTDVETVSPTEAWAISDDGYESHNEAHIYHWGGQRWSEVPFPTPDMGDPKWEFWELDDIEVVSPTEAWVVGYKVMSPISTTRPGPIVGLWNGTRWRIVPTGLWVRGRLSALTAEPGGGRLLAVGSRDVPGGREHDADRSMERPSLAPRAEPGSRRRKRVRRRRRRWIERLGDRLGETCG